VRRVVAEAEATLARLGALVPSAPVASAPVPSG